MSSIIITNICTFARCSWMITVQLFVTWCFKISCSSPRHHINAKSIYWLFLGNACNMEP
jgi:hypothetical protein